MGKDLDFLNKIINMKDRTEYKVKFYDNDNILMVRASNFITAGILAQAYMIHSEGVGFGIQYIESTRTGNRVPFDIKT